MTIIITEEERRLLTVDGFIETYYERCKTSASYREAYESCEEDYFRIVGERRYVDWSAFRVVLHRRHKKRAGR